MENQIIIREYTPGDRERVLQLLRLNTPAYFSPEEEQDFLYYLDHELEYYYVVESSGVIAGCGGINFSDDPATGKISWDIFDPGYQGMSLGSRLVAYRIEKLKTFKKLKRIIVRTTQLVYLFYKKQGFSLVEVVENYWAEGFHLYLMEYGGWPEDQSNVHQDIHQD